MIEQSIVHLPELVKDIDRPVSNYLVHLSSSRFGARSTLLNPHPGYQDPSPWLQRRSSITYGNLAEFSVLDTRQYRDDQAAGGGVDPPNSEQKDPSRSITGEAQERWLFEGLSRSRSRWNVLAQQVFFAQRDLKSGPGESFAVDAWDGYLGSRNRILDFIAERRIANPIVITGDVHNNWAADLKADFNDPNSPTVGTEFVGTSITSGGHGADTNQRAQGIIAQNPHLTFFNGQRGYIRCVLTPESFRADYRVLPFVSRRGAPIYNSPTVTLVRNGPLNTACRMLIEESSGCEDDQAALQGAENRSCLAQVMRSGTVGVRSMFGRSVDEC